MTLTGETARHMEAAVMDRRLLKRWVKRPQPQLEIESNGLEPDEPYARALIRAYWLRRIAG
jgi:hypothetical protein